MPRPALTNEQRRETRRRIREAAAKLYTQDGKSNISARAVAVEAGVSVGTLYSYYSNLGELLQSLWRQPVQRLVTQLEEQAQEVPDPGPRLRALLKFYVNFAEEERLLFQSAFLFVRPESVSPPSKVKLSDDRFFQVFRTAVSDGQLAGLFRPGDANELIQLVFSAVHGAIALPINMHRLDLEPSPHIAHKAIEAQMEWLQNTA